MASIGGTGSNLRVTSSGEEQLYLLIKLLCLYHTEYFVSSIESIKKFPHVGPDDALMMQDDNGPNCSINELPFSLYNFMFTPLCLFVKSKCDNELDQN